MANWVRCFCTYKYEVSDDGRVRNARTKKELKPYALKGYLRVSLWHDDGTRKGYLVNRLVLLSFVGESTDPKKKQSAHKDGDQQNNRLENLAWKDWGGNYEDRILHGTTPRKLTDEEVNLMRNFYANGQTQRKIAAHFNVDQSTVSRTVNGHRYRS